MFWSNSGAIARYYCENAARSTVVHEDLHQCGPVKIGKTRYFADDSDVSKLFDGLAIFPVTDRQLKNHAVHRQFGRMRSRQRQQCVIDSPRTAARRKNHWQLEFDHHIQHELFLIDWDQHAANPSMTSQSFSKLVGMLIRPRSISTPAQRAARSGETGGTNL